MRNNAVTALVVACFAGYAGAASAQSFEVATVKPTPPQQVGPDQPSIVQFLPNGFRRTNSTLRTLVRTACDVQDYQVTGGPDWADGPRFDIEARYNGAATRNDVLRMLQGLLAERFTLHAHRTSDEGPVYNLFRLPGGKLPPSAGDSTPASVRSGDYSGSRSMAQLAQYVSGVVGRPVFDRTGLAGNFDVHLSFAPDLRDADKPSIFTALQEQLGLRLESARGIVDLVIIDSAERPAAD
jgi:uncharacterized protein (TIGR03435 family)